MIIDFCFLIHLCLLVQNSYSEPDTYIHVHLPSQNRVGTTIYNLYIELIDIELPFDITVSSSSGLNAERGLFNQAPLQIPQVENGMDYGVSVEELGNNTKDYKDGLKINRRLRNHCKGLVSPTVTSKKRPPAYCYMIFL